MAKERRALAAAPTRSINMKNRGIALNAKNGFTLIELLIVSVLLGVVSLAIFGVFNSGIKIWQRMNSALTNEEINIFLSKFTRDISNGLKFSAINFAGDDEELRFATLLYSPRLEKRTVGQVSYAYRPGMLVRKERDFSQVYNEQEGSPGPILKNLDSCKFTYYAYDKEAKGYCWKEEWQKEQLPLAVRIELGYKNELGTHSIVRTVNIPVSK